MNTELANESWKCRIAPPHPAVLCEAIEKLLSHSHNNILNNISYSQLIIASSGVSKLATVIHSNQV